MRERKKLATRETLSRIALRLALERGIGNVRGEDIAAEANVSPRTFRNYFASKYEAIVARHGDAARQSAEALRTRPAGEPLWTAIEHAMLAPFADRDTRAGNPDPDRLAGIGLLFSEPALQAEMLRVRLEVDHEFAAAVAERTGTDPARDLYAGLVAGAVAAAVQAATVRWLHSDPPVQLASLIRAAIRQLAAGMPDPHGAAPFDGQQVSCSSGTSAR